MQKAIIRSGKVVNIIEYAGSVGIVRRDAG